MVVVPSSRTAFNPLGRAARWFARLVVPALIATAVARAAPAPTPPSRLAVLAFDAAGSDAGWNGLGVGLQSMLTTDLAALAAVRPSIEIVERARLKDIGAELRLAAAGAVDARSAAAIGKLLGASHLVVGSFTLVGARLRIDARLVRVATGAVVASASADGERDAFFELEKDVARRLIEGLGTPLTPRERAALAPIATANLDALRAYGDGLDLADRARELEALAALRRAAELDPAFALAHHTLADYERMVTDARAHAAAAQETANIAELRVAAQANAIERAAIADLVRRYEQPATPTDKAIAALLLAGAFNAHGGIPTEFAQLHAQADGFALARLRDRWYTNYLASAETATDVPIPLAPRIPRSRIKSASQADLDAFYRDLAEHTKRKGVTGSELASEFISAGRMLHLDLRTTLRVAERLLPRAGRQRPEDRVDLLQGLADAWIALGDTESAARLLGDARKATADPRELDRVAKALETGAALHAALLRKDALSDARREFVALGDRDSTLEHAFAGTTANPATESERWRARELGSVATLPFFWWQTVPVFPLAYTAGRAWRTPLRAGATPDPWRVEGLAWGAGQSRQDDSARGLWVLGDQPRDEVRLALDVDLARPSGLDRDWTFGQPPTDARPALVVLLGIDVLQPPRPAPVGRDAPEDVTSGAPIGLALRIDHAGTTLARVIPGPSSDRWERMTLQPISTAPLRLATAATTRVQITRRGTTLDVKVGAASHRFTASEFRAGWLVVGGWGDGYIAFTNPDLR